MKNSQLYGSQFEIAYLQSNTVSEDEVKCMLVKFGGDVLNKKWCWHLPFI